MPIGSHNIDEGKFQPHLLVLVVDGHLMVTNAALETECNVNINYVNILLAISLLKLTVSRTLKAYHNKYVNL